jgi:hypothetical protein
MRRRDFIKAAAAGVILGAIDSQSLASAAQLYNRHYGLQSHLDWSIKDYLHKMQNFDQPHTGDICLEWKLSSYQF